MPSRFGIGELLILLVIILILFGPGRIARIAGELGESIRNFRAGLSGEGKKKEKTEEPAVKTETAEKKE